jgi:beta-carotene/zeaxanthin 4-ketolase
MFCDSKTAEENRLLLSAVKNKLVVDNKKAIYGIVIALSIVIFWAISLVILLKLDITNYPSWAIAIAIIWQGFLYTGLFITGHDAMHGSLFPSNKKINHFLGALVVWLYSFLSYKTLLQKHWLHHHYPASEIDPDFHDGTHRNPIAWYLYFMKGYWGWSQFIGHTIVFNFARNILHISQTNLILFLPVALIFSSIQLFYFGTYLPHREPQGGYIRPHCAQTISLPIILSFIACYHFGYHREHHEYPHLPWWQLPTIHSTDDSANRFF